MQLHKISKHSLYVSSEPEIYLNITLIKTLAKNPRKKKLREHNYKCLTLTVVMPKISFY